MRDIPFRPDRACRPHGPALAARRGRIGRLLSDRCLRGLYRALILVVAVLPTAALCETRVALVVANSNYKSTPPLRNPSNDGVDVAQALRSVGFDVIFAADADKRAMDRAIVQFSRKSADADAVVFYYAGHGMQFQGRNYLVPTDAELEDQISVRYELTDLEDIKVALAKSRAVKILILDACRNNPLADRFSRSFATGARDVSATRGLAPIEKTGGMLVVYATQSNEIAEDGSGRNSPFTGAFLDQLKVPGLETSVLFRRISAEVYGSTGGRQEPELSISHFPDFFLNQAETDATLWERIRTTADKAQLQAFLARYPASVYAPEAKLRLDVMDRAQRDREEAEQRQTLQAEVARLAAENSRRDQIAALDRAREDDLAAKLVAAEAERRHMLDEVDALTREHAQRAAQKQDKDAAVVQAKDEAARARTEQASRDAALQAATQQEGVLKDEIVRLQSAVVEAKTANDHLADARADGEKLAEAQAHADQLAGQLAALEADRGRTTAQLQQLQAERLSRQSADFEHEAKVEAALRAADLARREKDARDDELRHAAERETKLEEEIAHLHAAAEAAERVARRTDDKPAALPTAVPAPGQAPTDVGTPARTTPEQSALVPAIRRELRRIGCYTGGDADWGTPPMTQALLAFSRHTAGTPAPAVPSDDYLKGLKARQKLTCPSPCGAGTVERGGTCVVKLMAVPKSEPAQKHLRAASTLAVRPAQPRVRNEPSQSPGKACFEFGGQKYCE